MKITELVTPCYVMEEDRLIHNLAILMDVEKDTGCRILLAQKAFSCYHLYPTIGSYLSGCTASGLYEARLGFEHMVKPLQEIKRIENHIYAPAYKAEDMKEIVKYCDHIVFNSVAQYEMHREVCADKNIGLRINPECSTQGERAIYDPCAYGSRFGMTARMLQEAFGEHLPEEIKGLHFHTLCEQDADDLAKTLAAVEEKFGAYLPSLSWLNMGGGHHITREGYQISLLKECITYFQNKYDLQIYLEPGEAIALDAGTLQTTVLDIVDNGIKTLVLDASAACHMPDVLEMPYRPPLKGAGESGQKKHTYRLSSFTCLAGDIIGDYSFDQEIRIGDVLQFEDMAIYSMVKNNTFNGIKLPSIVYKDKHGECRILREFGYEDYHSRL